MFAIFKRELKSYFLTPSAYIFMCTFLFISGLLFTSQIVFSMSSQYSEFLGTIIFIFILVVPLLTMKVFSEEKKNKTDQLLFTYPVSSIEIVLGKFLAPLTVFLITIIITFLYPILLSFHGDLEIAQIVGTYIGFILLGATLISIGVFISALTENMASAAIISFCTISFIWIIDLLIPIVPSSPLSSLIFIYIIIFIMVYKIYKDTGSLKASIISLISVVTLITALYLIKNNMFFSLISKIFNWLSLTTRFTYFPMGIIRLTDVVFYISSIIFLLYLTNRQIEKRHWAKEV